ncbi:adenylyl cyclase [Jatrophihabitans sp. YIM 134969]
MTAPAAQAAPAPPDLGPNVHVIDPSMPQADIQAEVDAVYTAQATNQFGERRDAILFLPGTYGSTADPLNFQVGYYTEVAGLGQNPDDVVINGSINVYNQCGDTGCIALNNFWRSMSNLTINVTDDPNDPQHSGCYSGEFWAVSQASPMRRVNIVPNGKNVTLMDYCTQPSYASGGFIADSRIPSTVVNGSQQQFLTRNSTIGGWSNGVWNAVFSGVYGAPAEGFPTADSNYYTTLTASPATKEKPYLFVDGSGTWQVFVPVATTGTTGSTWSSASQTRGRAIPLSNFYITKPGDTAATINTKLANGKNLLVTPGVYDVDTTIAVKRAGTVVLGLGMATLTSDTSAPTLRVGDVAGVDIAGLVFDAGTSYSSALLQVGTAAHRSVASRELGPTALHDVFFRIGGPHVGQAAVSLLVNSDKVILDDIWAWRADHGDGVGWTTNIAPTGVVVNGDDVTATGLFVEHYQGYETVWNGERGTVVFFQNEMPYDVPSPTAWTSDGRNVGYAAFKVGTNVRQFSGYGMGSYSFFNQGKDINASRAFATPTRPNVRFHHLLTIFLDPVNGSGSIRHVINNTGGASSAANPGTPVTVLDYPTPATPAAATG